MTQVLTEIYLNLTLDYCSDWTEREAVRELVANASDVNPDDFDVRISNNTLVVSNGSAYKPDGSYVTLQPQHWTIGKHQKHTTSSIGQFGEGLKIASVVLLRLGYTDIHIRSGDYSYYPYAQRSPYEDDDSQLVYVRVEKESSTFNRTQVKVRHWDDTVDYSDLFIFPNDDRILHQSPTRKILQRTGDELAKLYVSGMYVMDLNKAGFGDFDFHYGLDGEKIKLNRDRDNVSGYELRWDMGRVWGEVEDPRLIELLWESVKTGAAERNIDWDYVRFSVNTSDEEFMWVTALNTIYGGEVVISTMPTISQSVADMTDYIPVSFSNDSLIKFLKQLGVLEDIDVVIDDEEPINIPDGGKLDRIQSTNLRMARSRIRSVAEYLSKRDDVTYEPFELRPAMLGVDTDGELVEGVVLRERGISLFAPYIFEDRVKTFELLLIHMLAHWFYLSEDSAYKARYRETLTNLAAIFVARLI